jgi:ankyrin repeat protein
MLIKKKALMYYTKKSKRDSSPLFLAITKQNVKAIELFCDYGVDLASKDSVGHTPLIFAAINGYDDIVNYLTLRAKDINVEDKVGNTILILYLKK